MRRVVTQRCSTAKGWHTTMGVAILSAVLGKEMMSRMAANSNMFY